MIRYPRSREETSAPPSVEEISTALKEHWGIKAAEIRQASSSRVYYVDGPDRRVMFRANPGWDGSIPPPIIVRYIDHLSRQGAPAPDEERAAFPLIWAGYYTNRITFLRNRWTQRGQHSRSQKLREKILQLPAEAIKMAEELMA